MASLIRLKQIESSSFLTSAAAVGQDFSQSVIDIIQGEVAGVLPDGVISSSVQVILSDATGYSTLATDLEVAVVSGSIVTTQTLISSSISTSIAQTLSGSAASVTSLSSSVSASLTSLSQSVNTSLNLISGTYTTTQSFQSYTSSLGDTFATDIEVYLTASTIIDQGEF